MKVRIYNYNFPVKASYKGWSITLHDVTPFISWNRHYKACFSINTEEYAQIIMQHIRSQHIPYPENLYERIKRNAENFAKSIKIPHPIEVKAYQSAGAEMFAGNRGVVNRALSKVEQHIDHSMVDIWEKFCAQLDLYMLLL